MAKKKSASATKKAQYTRYKAENTQEKNRVLKLKKHLKTHPEDSLAIAALDKINKGGNVYRRRKPENRGSIVSTYVNSVGRIMEPLLVDKEVQSALGSKDSISAINKLYYKRNKVGNNFGLR